jgi:intracellular multiplication protein IcmD
MKGLVHGPASLLKSAAFLLSILLLAAVCVPSVRSFAARGAPAPSGAIVAQPNSCATTEQCLDQLSGALESLSPEQLAALGTAIRTQLTSLGSRPVEVPNVGEIGGSTTGLEQDLRKLLAAGTYVAGLATAIAAIEQFKAHELDPKASGAALLFVAVAMIFTPATFRSVAGTMFGSDGITAGVEGLDNLRR